VASINLNSSLVKTVMLKIVGDGGDAERVIAEVDAAAKRLEEEHPELKIQIDRAKAMADAVIMKAEMRRVFEDPIVQEVKPKFSLTSLATRAFWADILGRMFGTSGGTGGGFGGGVPFIGQGLAKLTGAGGLGPVGGSLAGIAAGGAAVNALAGIAQFLTAGGLGLGSFGALAYPTVSSIFQSNSGYATAIGNYQTASQNLTTAIGQSPADMKAYQAALAAAEPDMRNVLNLLTNQNIQWQKLSPVQQASATALANNKDELKTLLPDQKKALDALLKQRDAWNALDPAQQKVVGSLQAISGQWDAMVSQLEPQVMKIIGDFLPIVQKLLPYVGQFAQAVAPAIDQLVRQFDKFVQSKGFKEFMDRLIKLAPSTITAIARGIGQLAGAIGNLISSGSGATMLRVISDIVTAFAGLINFVASRVGYWNKNFSNMVTDVEHWAHDVEQWVHKVSGFIQGLINDIGKWFTGLPGMLASAGRNAIQAFLGGLTSIPVAGTITKVIGGVIGTAKHILGIGSPSKVFSDMGRNSWEGFRIGMTQAAGGMSLNVNGTRSGGYGGGLALQVLPGAGGAVEHFIATIIRQYVVAHGGGGKNSVQTALGQAH